jgi:hypothetical protein
MKIGVSQFIFVMNFLADGPSNLTLLGAPRKVKPALIEEKNK